MNIIIFVRVIQPSSIEYSLTDMKRKDDVEREGQSAKLADAFEVGLHTAGGGGEECKNAKNKVLNKKIIF